MPSDRARHIQVGLAAAALLCFALGYTWTIGVMSQYLTDLVCLQEYNASFNECQNRTNTSQWELITVAANNLDSQLTIPSAIVQAVMAPFLCSLADFTGRKGVLVFSMLCASFLSLCVAVVPHAMFATIGPYLAAVSGLGGGLFTYLAVTFAFVVDLYEDQAVATRAVVIGRVEAFCWAGLCIGPFLGTAISQGIAPENDATNIQDTFFFAFGFQVAGAVLLLLGMREPREFKKKPDWVGLIPYGPLWKVGSWSVVSITVANAMVQLAASCGVELLPDFIYAYYESASELADLSYVFTVYFGCCGLGEMFLLPLLSRYMSSRAILMSTIAATGVSWALFGLAGVSGKFALIWVAAVCCCVNSLVFPVVRAFITQTLGPEHHGNGLGLLAFLEQLGAILAPYFERWLWKEEVNLDISGHGHSARGLSFYVFGGVALTGLLFAGLVKFPQADTDRQSMAVGGGVMENPVGDEEEGDNRGNRAIGSAPYAVDPAPLLEGSE